MRPRSHITPPRQACPRSLLRAHPTPVALSELKLELMQKRQKNRSSLYLGRLDSNYTI
ncbi:modular polyketide synthase [Edwardsiella piscicida]|nr:modular polyketide synthase [Edwardsiella piscicida]